MAASAGAASDSPAVERFLASLTHPRKAEIVALRAIILRADPRITEGIKWNAPSFHCGDWFATFHLRSPDAVQIIFHRGAKAKAVPASHYVNDPAGILSWITNDRCSAKFVGQEDVTAKQQALTKVVADWARALRAEFARP